MTPDVDQGTSVPEAPAANESRQVAASHVRRILPRSSGPMFPPGTLPPDSKGRILVSALTAFAERGFYGTSIRTIADGASINSATLYAHFESKQHILAALVSIGSHELQTRVEEAGVEATNSTDRLVKIIEAAVIAHATYPLLAIVTNSEFYALEPSMAEAARAGTVAASGLLRTTLAEGISEGAFHISNVEVATHVLGGMVQHLPLRMNWATDTANHLADEYASLALRIVGREPGRKDESADAPA